MHPLTIIVVAAVTRLQVDDYGFETGGALSTVSVLPYASCCSDSTDCDVEGDVTQPDCTKYTTREGETTANQETSFCGSTFQKQWKGNRTIPWRCGHGMTGWFEGVGFAFSQCVGRHTAREASYALASRWVFNGGV